MPTQNSAQQEEEALGVDQAKEEALSSDQREEEALSSDQREEEGDQREKEALGDQREEEGDQGEEEALRRDQAEDMPSEPIIKGKKRKGYSTRSKGPVLPFTKTLCKGYSLY